MIEKDIKNVQFKQQRHKNDVAVFYLKISHLIRIAIQSVFIVDFEQIKVR